VLAEPNGAGKSTNAAILLPDLIAASAFVNADVIEREITTPDAGSQAFAAGRLMLEEIHRLREIGASFAFETTLASRTFAPPLHDLKAEGYRIYLLYFWLNDPDLCIERVANRVRLGGHHVPADIIRRRYERGLRNFFDLYRPIVDTWHVCDNSGGSPVLVAERLAGSPDSIVLPDIWQVMQQKAGCR
jgi:predicted ABC-type ATPase